MAFFDLPSDGELIPEVRRIFDEHRRLTGTEVVIASWRAYGRSPRIVEARFKALQNLHVQSSFPATARNVAVMLMAHAKRCRTCFAFSRSALEKLGFDEAALDGMCANPEALPLQEHDRLFVHYALKIATGSADLTLKDFKEMAAHGFSREEIQEIIGFAAYWTMTMVFSQAALAALTDD
jgi:alkylhydroperoxidase family enzyme